MENGKLRAARVILTRVPLAVVLVATTMVLIDFAFNYMDERYVAGVGWVRYFTAERLYDLTLHLSMLALALSAALIFAAIARAALSAPVKVSTASRR